ncbi:Ubiquitin-like-conjugating enzyme ATG10 [Echinococcus granulosus]|uniref:Ubiquitin-like-conjugating enzyme ATG10 n=1 Tax=Echinococcus granulosus TaxID=6210 RepID=U6JHD3_ECHGR|nr:Autophagy-related protein [Echinococcus granulosus]EUB60607.1 Autophagy-related protein [Echinococcus granulosus]KAH9282624.1 Ubiquitin-like-conjugating enzyme ATG10 [Echinococcus granulosus]CDS23453.1 ubiquitin conjugating enzyme ATG10 [Echinococcus granulosus]
MNTGTLSAPDYNSSLAKVYSVLQEASLTDIWKLESFTTSPYPELVCYHDCQISSVPARLEYRTTYNEAFAVPTFLFRGSLDDGSQVPLSYFWQSFSKASDHSQSDLWSVISQTEHKATGVPYFFLHPCKTRTLMLDINPPTATSYLIFWLSFVARYFDIFIPPSITFI